MTRTTAQTPVVPDDLLDTSAGPPLSLKLECRRCRHEFSGDFEWAYVAPKSARKNETWDGVVLSRIVVCPACDAVDEYILAADVEEQLLQRVVPAPTRGRVLVAVSQLWDGTIARRPSQALGRLRQLTREKPDSAEAFRRLGNGCERWKLMDEAVESWKKALSLDPEDLEAAYSLAAWLWGAGGRPQEAVGYLRQGLKALPTATAKKSTAARFGEGLVRVLRDFVESTNQPVALMAMWSDGEVRGQVVVRVSSVDLHRVDDFGILADFLVSAEVRGIDLTSELPDDNPTQLERLLNDDEYGGDADLGSPPMGFSLPPSLGHAEREKRSAEKKRKRKLQKDSRRRNR